MPAKKWWSSKKTTKKETKNIEKDVKTNENAGSTVIEKKMSDAELESGIITQAEKEIGLKKSTVSKKKKESQVIGDIGWTKVTKPQWRIKFEAQVAPYPIFLLPSDLRRWLISNGLTTDVYKRDKEWLEKHHVNLDMVEKLKKFLTEKL